MMATVEWWSLGVTLQLVMNREHLNQLDVPEDVSAVVVIKHGGCETVVDIKTVEKIVEAFHVLQQERA